MAKSMLQPVFGGEFVNFRGRARKHLKIGWNLVSWGTMIYNAKTGKHGLTKPVLSQSFSNMVMSSPLELVAQSWWNHVLDECGRLCKRFLLVIICTKKRGLRLKKRTITLMRATRQMQASRCVFHISLFNRDVSIEAPTGLSYINVPTGNWDRVMQHGLSWRLAGLCVSLQT